MMLMPLPTVSNDWNSHFSDIYLTNIMALLMMSSVSCDVNTGITWPKSHVWPYFNHPKLTNKLEPLTVPLVSCDVGLVPTASLDQKDHVIPCFNYVQLMNNIVPLIILLTLHNNDICINDLTCLKKSSFTLVDHCDLLNAMVPLTTPLEPQRYF